MQLSLLGFQLLHSTVLAGGSYFAKCYCLNQDNAIVRVATQSACDAINHSDYHDDSHPQPRCSGTGGHVINDHCFDCLCKRTPGLHGTCDQEVDKLASVFWRIKCGAGC